MISCLCVTRGDRPILLSEAVADFVRQTFPDRELVILHDGDDAVHARIRAIVKTHTEASIRVERTPPGPRLGELRNIAMTCARGEWICQWDDDDRCHPERLRLQWEHAQRERAAVNYLVDQLHWFPSNNLLFWDDWSREPYPLNLIQGTILARRVVMPPYPGIGQGEDTLQTHALLRAEASKAFHVSRLSGAGWCHIYRFHGGNVFDAAHHRAISAAKHLPQARLLPRLALLRDRLKEYRPELPPMRMPLGTETELVTLGPPDAA
jgi:glycosyltransferase involved in cell wall biosynthesis